MVSLESFFISATENRDQKLASTYSGDYPFVLSRKKNLGILLVRIVPDSKGIPFRMNYDVNEMWIPTFKDGSTTELNLESNTLFSVPSEGNYQKPLTHGQQSLLAECLDLMNKMTDFGYILSNVAEVVYFFGKPSRFVDIDEKVQMTDPNQPLRIFRHHSRNFYKALDAAIKAKRTNLGSSAFLESYFNRDPSATRNLISINTSMADIGYNVVVSFENEAAPQGVFLTKEDLERSFDLNQIDPVVSEFQDEVFLNARKIMKTFLNESLEEGRNVIGATIFEEIPPKEVEAKVEVPKPATTAKPRRAPF